MSGRGRRVAVALIVLALLLAAGRWGAEFLAERLWEAAVSQKVAIAGARLALLRLMLELALLGMATLWFLVQLSVAARIALPDRPPPEDDAARTWPRQLPRWTLAVLALVMGGLLGSGGSGWVTELLLALDGVRVGVRDPLLSADLGVFVRQVPLWLDLQHRATLLIAVALGAVVLLHIAGETIRITDRRLGISPRARGQLALLLALLALALGWGSALEPYRLASGLRGPLLPSEFSLRSLVSQIQAGLAVTAALFSFLWWLRVRGSAVLVLWLLFGTALLIGRGLPLHGGEAAADPTWQVGARGLDSVAFQLGGVEGKADSVRPPADSLTPSLWDAVVLAPTMTDSATLSELHRGWIGGTRQAQPGWLAVRELRGQLPALLAVSDDRVSPTGAPLFWHEADTVPSTGTSAYRRLESRTVRPLGPRVVLAAEGPGVIVDGWAKRVVLAWALQAPAVFRAPRGSRIAWRLDPGMRLRAVAPFVHWTAPRARVIGTGLVWQSDGLLTSSLFPSSMRVPWIASTVSMVRSSFLGIVNAASGEVRIFLRDPADSLAAGWARITRPLIESPAAIPPELRQGEAYPEELLLAQAQVLEGAPWAAGRLERASDGTAALPPAAAGGTALLVPFIHPSTGNIGAVLQAVRTPSGDSLHLVRGDSLWRIEGSARLNEAWERFPFQSGLRDSVRAVAGSFEEGRVRYALAREGVVAYQPSWAVSATEQAQLVLVNVALGRRNASGRIPLGTGRTLQDAWKNLRGEMGPGPPGYGAQATLEEARRLMLHADSALKRGDLQERERTLAALRELLAARRP